MASGGGGGRKKFGKISSSKARLLSSLRLSSSSTSFVDMYAKIDKSETSIYRHRRRGFVWLGHQSAMQEEKKITSVLSIGTEMLKERKILRIGFKEKNSTNQEPDPVS